MAQERDTIRLERVRVQTPFAARGVRLGSQRSSRQPRRDRSQEPPATRAGVTDETIRGGVAARAVREGRLRSSPEWELQRLERQARIAQGLCERDAKRAAAERREAARTARYEDRSSYLRYARYVRLALVVWATWKMAPSETIIHELVRLLL
jgi:hypothetical protein